MTVALILLVVLIVAGVLLWLHDRLTSSPYAPEQTAEEPAECCGMHITCERDSLLAAVSEEIEYYDDEELDVYRDRDADSYADAEIEQFRDVLLTTAPADIAGWARSLQLRHINLPTPVRDELIMIVAEARRQHTADNAQIS